MGNNVRFQCPRCGPEVQIELSLPSKSPFVCQVSMVVQCPRCRKLMWFLSVQGLSVPLLVPLDSREMHGSLVSQLIYMIAELEKTLAAPNQAAVESGGLTDDVVNVPAKISADMPIEPNSLIVANSANTIDSQEYAPMPESSATHDQINGGPISRLEAASFAGRLNGYRGDVRGIENI